MRTRSLPWIVPLTSPRNHDRLRRQLPLDPAGWSDRQGMLRQLDRPGLEAELETDRAARRPTGTRGSSHAAIASGTLAVAVAGTSPRANVINSVDVHPASIWSSASASRRSMVSP